jgi:uncharacterized protein
MPKCWAAAAPSAQTVGVRGGSITLPFLRYRRTQTIQGDPGVQLASHMQDTVTVPADQVSSAETDFTLPPALEDPPAGSVYTGDDVEPVGGA